MGAGALWNFETCTYGLHLPALLLPLIFRILFHECTYIHAGFLNAYFSDWFSRPAAARLPFKYNALRTVYWTTHDKNPGYWEAIGPIKVRC